MIGGRLFVWVRVEFYCSWLYCGWGWEGLQYVNRRPAVLDKSRVEYVSFLGWICY
jgi:hypothetical protein